MGKEIKTNKIRYNHCNDIIESRHRLDCVKCSCGRIAVDGGKVYLRRVFETEDDYLELSEYADGTLVE